MALVVKSVVSLDLNLRPSGGGPVEQSELSARLFKVARLMRNTSASHDYIPVAISGSGGFRMNAVIVGPVNFQVCNCRQFLLWGPSTV